MPSWRFLSIFALTSSAETCSCACWNAWRAHSVDGPTHRWHHPGHKRNCNRENRLDYFNTIVNINWHSPDQCEDEQLLRIEGEFGGEVGEEQGSHSVRILEPHGQQAEDCCTADRGKEAAPVVAHRKVCGGYLNAEEDACRGCLLFVLALTTLCRECGV